MVRRLIRFFTGRLTIFSLLICIQGAVIAGAVTVLSFRSVYLFAGFFLLSVAVAVGIVVREEHPSYKVAWVIAIMVFPLLGGLFYLALGNKGISRAERRRLVRHIREHPSLFSPLPGASAKLRGADPAGAVQSDYITRISGFPPFGSTQVEYCPLGEDQFRLMMEELPGAKRFILLEYFIIQQGIMWDSLLELLRRKAAQGVEVLVLYDDLGCIQTLPQDYDKLLRSYGLRCAVFNPFRPSLDAAVNYRDHRKICVIDGEVGFCGGINLADEYINAYKKHGHWKDTAVLLRGEAVQSLTRMFLQNWTSVTGESQEDCARFLTRPRPRPAPGWVQPYADSPLDRYNVAENVYLQMISRASRYVYITSPYLILDNEMVTALRAAAESGVDVRVVTPHIADKWFVHMVTRSYYPALIASGVRIYEYLPGFIHAKMFVSDDKMAVVGTANLDYRSLYLHYECAVALYHTPATAGIKKDILDTIGRSRLITLGELEAQPRGRKLASALLRLFAPLM